MKRLKRLWCSIKHFRDFDDDKSGIYLIHKCMNFSYRQQIPIRWTPSNITNTREMVKYLSFYCLTLALFFTANDTMSVSFSKACWIAQYGIVWLVRHHTKLESRLYAYTCALEKELTILWPIYIKPLPISNTYSRGPMSTSF